jgi:N-acetyl sugar amidotransferase
MSINEVNKKIHYKRCTRCVMDTSDPCINFNSDGVCNHCIDFEAVLLNEWFRDEAGHTLLLEIIEQIKSAGTGRKYDCILGLSGGVDSSYLALKMNEWGLRPLVMHVDAGWNSELAVSNIEAIVKHCNYDLHTHVVDWEDMRELQLAYLKSGIANQDVPQDHVFFASLYHFAIKNRIRYIFSGGNLATEGIFPSAWGEGSAMDSISLKYIYRKFGSDSFRSYRTISFWSYYLHYPFIKKMRVIRPLNYMPYCKADAIRELQSAVGFKTYSRKHGESLFTKLFQNYYLPKRFGYDKRLPHLSSLIISGQLSREEALAQLKEPLYVPEELEFDIAYLCKKLDISRSEFEDLMRVPKRHYTDFPNWNRRQRLVKKAQEFVARVTGRRISVYS